MFSKVNTQCINCEAIIRQEYLSPEHVCSQSCEAEVTMRDKKD